MRRLSGALSLKSARALCQQPGTWQGVRKPLAVAWMDGHVPLLCLVPPLLFHLLLLIASISYSVILRLVNGVDIGAAEE